MWRYFQREAISVREAATFKIYLRSRPQLPPTPDSSLSFLGLPNIKERNAVNRWSSFLLPINPCASFVHASHVPFSAWDPNRDDRGRVSPMQMCSADVLRGYTYKVVITILDLLIPGGNNV